MNIRIKTKDFELSSAVRKYLDIRIAAFEKLLGSDATVSQCEVELGRAAGRPRHGDHLYFAEFTIRAPRRKLVRATNNESTINAAIDNAKEEAAKQLRKQKTVMRSSAKKDGARVKHSLKAGR